MDGWIGGWIDWVDWVDWMGWLRFGDESEPTRNVGSLSWTWLAPSLCPVCCPNAAGLSFGQISPDAARPAIFGRCKVVCLAKDET